MNKQKDMSLTFEQLISSIRHVHDQLAAQAGRAVNISLTLFLLKFFIMPDLLNPGGMRL